jgi:hypothetical protein
VRRPQVGGPRRMRLGLHSHFGSLVSSGSESTRVIKKAASGPLKDPGERRTWRSMKATENHEEKLVRPAGVPAKRGFSGDGALQ